MSGFSSSGQQVQRAKATTDSGGAYTWTFPVPYGVGVTPIVQLTAEDGTAARIDYKVTATSNTSASIQVNKATTTNLLGVVVLESTSTGAVSINLMAMTP